MPSLSPHARRTWLLAAMLALATIAAYVPALHNGFVEFDDPAYVTANVHVQQGLTWHNLAWALTSVDEANWHPLTWLSHMGDVQFFGLAPTGHHATSILIHTLNAAFLFLLLQRGTGFTWRSLTVAALFAFHPMNVENVAWVAERKSLLCMFFSLVTVAFYARYVAKPSHARLLALAVSFAAALASKPMAVTLPVLLLLVDYWPLRRLNCATDLATLVREKFVLFVMSIMSAIVTIVAQHQGHAVSDLVHLPLSQRLANALVATVTYARRTIWPNDLSYFYPHPGATLTYGAILTAIVVLIAISVFVYQFRAHRHLVFGWLLFLISLLPVIGILQVGMQAMADRYAYLPTIGLFAAIVWEFADLIVRFKIPVLVPATVAVASLAGLATTTVATERYWHDSLALFTRAQEVARIPNSYIETNYAAALLDHHRDDEALEHFRIAEQLAPNDFISHYNVGHLLAQRGDFSTAAKEYEEALRCAKQPAARARVLYSLGVTYLNLGDRRQAADVFRLLLNTDPNNAQARALLDSINAQR